MYDDFGLSSGDVLKFNKKVTPYLTGLHAWWVLQHQRGYKAFQTKVNTLIKTNGSIN
jgi:hypothetical protein